MKPYAILGAIMGLGVLLLASSQITLSTNIAQANEEARPADISAIVIMPLECQDCFDPQKILAAIATGPAVIAQEETIAYPSERAQELIETHSLTTLPALILSGETDKKNIASILEPQTRASTDARVWTNMPAPYLDLAAGEVAGRVGVTFLTREPCDGCYDVRTHETILRQSFGMTLKGTETASAASARGRELIRLYNITALPTVVISKDAEAYPAFVNAWKSVGTEEEDGSFIFRKLSALGTYFDLVTGTLITPKTP